MTAVRLFAPNSPGGLTVRDIITVYQRHCAAETVHGPAAKADREFTFRLFVEAAGHLPVAECRPFHLTDFIESHPEWRSVSTRRAKANAIRAAFNWAARQERIDRNPFKGVQYAEHERRAEMPDDVLRRISELANKAFERAVRFLRLTGCRTGELCAAAWADVDLDRGVWTIHRHKSRRFTGRPKVVALVGEAVSLLRQIASASAPAVDARATAGPAVMALEVPALSTPIFLNTRGRPWTRRTLGQQLARMKRRFQIETRASLHGIRHRMATASIEAGAPIKLVSQQLGHASVVITERYYHSGLDQIDAMREAAAKGLPKP